MKEFEHSIEIFEKKFEAIKKTYAEACEFLLIDKNDEKASNSQEFFKFFTNFFDQVVKCMPKEEKKRQPPKVIPKALGGGSNAPP